MRDLFWFMVSKLSVHGHLATLLLGLWWGKTSWWKHMAEETADLMEAGRQRERVGLVSQYPLQGHVPRDLLRTRPHLKVLPPPSSTKLGTKLFTHGLLGEVSDPKYSSLQRQNVRGDYRDFKQILRNSRWNEGNVKTITNIYIPSNLLTPIHPRNPLRRLGHGGTRSKRCWSRNGTVESLYVQYTPVSLSQCYVAGKSPLSGTPNERAKFILRV